MSMYYLQDWILLQDKRIYGKCYGNPKFQDGEYVTTSPVTYQDSNIIITRSGSTYQLGIPRIL